MSGGAERAERARGSRGRPCDSNARNSPAPSSCLMTEWGEWDECSATCGMGMKKRHRMIKMSPADGSMCKSETSQAEKCMMPECRELAWEVGTGSVWRTTAPATTPIVKVGGWASPGGEIWHTVLAGYS